MKAKYLIIGGIAVASGFAGIMAAGVIGFLVLTHQRGEISMPQTQAAPPGMPAHVAAPQTPVPSFAQNLPGPINQNADLDEDSSPAQAYQQNAAAMYAQQRSYEAGRQLAAMLLAQRWAQAAQSYNGGYQGYQNGYYGGGGGGRQLSTSEKYGSLVNSGSVLSDGQGTIGYVGDGYSATFGH